MATSELVRPEVASPAPTVSTPHETQGVVRLLLDVASSLWLTVALFAMGIFLVFAGTLAQVDHGVWYVVDHSYFRVWIARIDFLAFVRLAQMFFPVHWNPTGGFYFPGGKTIGGLLLINLLAAHGLRFKVASVGRRRTIGFLVIALGALVTFLVVRSGANEAVESELSAAFCSALWQAVRAGLVLLALAGAYLLVLRYHAARRLEWSVLLAADIVLALVAVWLLVNPAARLDDSGLRILWQLVKGTAAGAVLLAGCVMVFRKRAGIVLLHGGVALLMFSELLTGMTAEESQMTIAEGASANYSSDIRTTELAVVDHAGPDVDRVSVVPESILSANVGQTDRISDAELPFTVQVLRWLPNSRLEAPAQGNANPASAGFGLARVAEPLAPASGVGDSTVDSPSAYVELRSKTDGQSLGTFLVSQWLPEQTVAVDGHEYGVALRFKRIYWPFTLALKDFRYDRYQGTNIAKNFSSLVTLRDPERNVDREVTIWMNNPLRYGGTTFYQSSFDPETEKATVLQVVTNPGWMIPYVSCVLVAIGMLAHFGQTLVRFSRRRAEDATRAQIAAGRAAGGRTSSRQRATQSASGAAATFAKWFPAIVVAVFAFYLAGKMRMPESGPSDIQIYQFAKLPLAYQGRIKPYDTLARNTLQILSGRQEVIASENGKTTKLPAIRWLLDVISGADAADAHRVFRIDNLELLDVLGLEPREGSFRYSLGDLHGKLGELDRQISLASAQPEGERSLFQRKVLDLGRKLNLYAMLTQAFGSPQIGSDPEHIVEDMQRAQQDVLRLRAASAPHAVPPTTPTGRWSTLMEAELDLLRDRVANQPVNPATVALATMLSAYASRDATTFNGQLAEDRDILARYEQSLTDNRPQLKAAGVANAEVLSQKKIDFEVFYNQFSPFYYAAVLYVVAFVLGALSWLGWTDPLRRASIWLLWFTFAVHTFALAARIYISGRPPVTNLYSSAVFIGWACVLLALVFESVYRMGLGNIVAAVIGFLTLLVAHFLSLDGDTFIVLQAVLDTQFWLATHVVCITLGYSTTFLAGALGVLYVLLVHVAGVLDEEQRRQLARMIYGTLCFAIFFSFVGTVLGGLWADDSWGRFWGWDPKENGALIIVLYNALVLHARWGGLVRSRGLALLVIGGNIVTTWSWFGVNELGVGLHSYGASESSTAMWLLTFAAVQVGLIVLGALPREWYTSLGPRRGSPTA